jgi:hypothetical protein
MTDFVKFVELCVNLFEILGLVTIFNELLLRVIKLSSFMTLWPAIRYETVDILAGLDVFKNLQLQLMFPDLLQKF